MKPDNSDPHAGQPSERGGTRQSPDIQPEHLAKLRTALSLHQAGELQSAIAIYEALSSALPATSTYLHPYGFALLQAGETKKSLSLLKRAFLLAPGEANILHHLGCALLFSASTALAQSLFRQAVVCDPNHAEAWFNLAEIQREHQSVAQAAESYAHAVRLRPKELQWQISLASSLLDIGRVEEAIPILQRVRTWPPGAASAAFQLGRAHWDKMEADKAIAYYRQTLSILPASAEGWTNYKNTQQSLDLNRAAVNSAMRARIVRPGDATLEYNFSEALLSAGELARGYAAYHWRNGKKEAKLDRRGLPPRWDGSASPDGRALLICHEQGIGDEIRLASCIEDAAEVYEGPVIVETDARLVPLYERTFPSIKFIEKLTRTQDTRLFVDFSQIVNGMNVGRHILLGDLMEFARPTIESFPKTSGYLKPALLETKAWKKTFQEKSDAPAIGFCWRSGLVRPGWHHDNLRVLNLVPLLEGACFLPVRLQYDDCEEELVQLELRSGTQVFRPAGIDLREELDRVAALIAALDLVISINTSVLAIAGAVGTPALSLHAKRGFIFLGAPKMPWFPSEVPFIKGGNRSWEPVIGELKNYLEGALKTLR